MTLEIEVVNLDIRFINAVWAFLDEVATFSHSEWEIVVRRENGDVKTYDEFSIDDLRHDLLSYNM